VIGTLLDLSHIRWRTCVADLLSDHTRHLGTLGSLDHVTRAAGRWVLARCMCVPLAARTRQNPS